jgi:hypothetical protein
MALARQSLIKFPGGSGRDCLSRDQVGRFRLQLLAAVAVNCYDYILPRLSESRAGPSSDRKCAIDSSFEDEDRETLRVLRFGSEANGSDHSQY